jgi:hypothetical protein
MLKLAGSNTARVLEEKQLATMSKQTEKISVKISILRTVVDLFDIGIIFASMRRCQVLGKKLMGEAATTQAVTTPSRRVRKG